MSEQKRERGVKVLAVRSLWMEEDGKRVKKPAGSILVLSKKDIKHFGAAVTKDLPEGEDE